MAKKAPKVELTSVAHLVKVSSNNCKDQFTLEIDGCTIQTTDLGALNTMIIQLGFKPVRTTRNLMNREAGTLVIDGDTPIYCDVGSESYWSM